MDNEYSRFQGFCKYQWILFCFGWVYENNFTALRQEETLHDTVVPRFSVVMKFLFFQFCDVAEMAIIHKTSEPNLAIKKMIVKTLAFYISGYFWRWNLMSRNMVTTAIKLAYNYGLWKKIFTLQVLKMMSRGAFKIQIAFWGLMPTSTNKWQLVSDSL